MEKWLYTKDEIVKRCSSKRHDVVAREIAKMLSSAAIWDENSNILAVRNVILFLGPKIEAIEIDSDSMCYRRIGRLLAAPKVKCGPSLESTAFAGKLFGVLGERVSAAKIGGFEKELLIKTAMSEKLKSPYHERLLTFLLSDPQQCASEKWVVLKDGTFRDYSDLNTARVHAYIDAIRERKSYKMWVNWVKFLKTNPKKKEILEKIHETIDARWGYGSYSNSRRARESLKLAIEDSKLED